MIKIFFYFSIIGFLVMIDLQPDFTCSPWKEICFDHIFIHLTIKDLFCLQNVCHRFIRLIDEYFERMESVDFSIYSSENSRISWPCLRLMLKDNRSICDLNLSHCKWIDDTRFLCLITNQNRLKSINLSSTFYISNRSLMVMALYCPYLETIILENCGWLQPETLYCIAENCHQLITLNLASCWNLNDESIKILLEKCGHSIQNLIIARIYSLTNESLSSIRTFCLNIRFLDISFCWKITDSGLKYLIDCKNLEQISIKGCSSITCVGRQYLCEYSNIIQN
nr:F-box/LRR-repeat protein 15-like [Dermatophagoides farinae]